MSYGKVQLREHSDWQREKLLFDDGEDEALALEQAAEFHEIARCIKRSDGLHIAFEGAPHSYRNEIHYDPESHNGTYAFGDTRFHGRGRLITEREIPYSAFLRYVVLTATTLTGTRFAIRVGIHSYSAVEPDHTDDS